MPLYAFICRSCGPFDAFRPVSEADAAMTCSSCGEPATRVFTPPGLALLAPPVRQGLDLEEKSRHEPDVVGQKAGRPLAHRHTPTPPWVFSH